MIDHTLWVDRYRPKSIDELVLKPDFRKKVDQWIEDGDVPHLLLSGDAGVGKTSLALILADAIAPEDTMLINASNENGIDTIRNKVSNFIMSVSMNGLKIVIMDESCRLSPNGQDALKGILEEYSDFARFIFTANSPERIIAPLKSRCQSFAFGRFTKKQIMMTLAKILVSEKVTCSPDQLELIVESAESDMRKAINLAQFASLDGKLTVSRDMMTNSDYKFKIIDHLNRRELTAIRQLMADEDVKDFTQAYRFLFDNSSDIKLGKSHTETMLILSEYLYRDSTIADREINFAACCLQLMKKE